jgi:hypothetical protein
MDSRTAGPPWCPHGLRPPCDERRHPADVPALLADLRDAAELHVLDVDGIEVVVGEQARSAACPASSSPRIDAERPVALPIGERTASMISASECQARDMRGLD